MSRPEGIVYEPPQCGSGSGTDQREDQIGAAGVDLVVEQLVRGELGIPPFQKEVLIKGEWVEGPTVRPLISAPQGARKFFMPRPGRKRSPPAPRP